MRTNRRGNGPLSDLLDECVVEIIVNGLPMGTGFFVGPGQVVTCRHVLRASNTEPQQYANKDAIRVVWNGTDYKVTNLTLPKSTNSVPGDVELPGSAPDLAHLLVAIEAGHPCVKLADKEFPPENTADVLENKNLYICGHTANSKFDSLLVEWEVLRGSPREVKLKAGAVTPGHSGSPVLWREGGSVIGVVSRSRGIESAIGGIAILSETIFECFEKVYEDNLAFHSSDTRWAIARGATTIDRGKDLAQKVSGIGRGISLPPPKDQRNDNQWPEYDRWVVDANSANNRLFSGCSTGKMTVLSRIKNGQGQICDGLFVREVIDSGSIELAVFYWEMPDDIPHNLPIVLHYEPRSLLFASHETGVALVPFTLPRNSDPWPVLCARKFSIHQDHISPHTDIIVRLDRLAKDHKEGNRFMVQFPIARN